MTNFTDWLSHELEKRGWSPSDLARQMGSYPATVSKILNGERNPGPDFCRALARALNLPPETVFRKAGLLPPKPDPDPEIEEALHLIAQLPTPVRKLVLLQIRALAEAQQPANIPAQKRPKTAPSHGSG